MTRRSDHTFARTQISAILANAAQHWNLLV